MELIMDEKDKKIGGASMVSNDDLERERLVVLAQREKRKAMEVVMKAVSLWASPEQRRVIAAGAMRDCLGVSVPASCLPEVSNDRAAMLSAEEICRAIGIPGDEIGSARIFVGKTAKALGFWRKTRTGKKIAVSHCELRMTQAEHNKKHVQQCVYDEHAIRVLVSELKKANKYTIDEIKVARLKRYGFTEI